MLHNYKIKFTSHSLASIKQLDIHLNKLEVVDKKIIFLPRKKKIFTLTKSPHVNNKAKEHFKIEKFNRLVCLTTSLQVLKTLLKKLPNDLLIKATIVN
jgi:ribosomal protein S10